MADTGQLKTNLKELTKQFIVYDVQGRMTDLYEARADAAHGTPCILTEYSYDGLSGRVLKRQESLSTWDSTYDM